MEKTEFPKGFITEDILHTFRLIISQEEIINYCCNVGRVDDIENDN